MSCPSGRHRLATSFADSMLGLWTLSGVMLHTRMLPVYGVVSTLGSKKNKPSAFRFSPAHQASTFSLHLTATS